MALQEQAILHFRPYSRRLADILTSRLETFAVLLSITSYLSYEACTPKWWRVENIILFHFISQYFQL